MTVRDGMTTLVSMLHNLTDADTDAIFTDDYLQDTLDLYKQQYRYVILVPDVTRVDQNTVIYVDYFLPPEIGDWFEMPTDNVINEHFALVNYNFQPILFGNGTTEMWATYDDNIKRIRLGADSLGKFILLTLYSYDLYGAAAEVWTVKASLRGKIVDFKSDNHAASMSQDYKACLERAKYFASRSNKSKGSHFIRSDQGAGYDRDGQHTFVTRLRRGVPLNG